MTAREAKIFRFNEDRPAIVAEVAERVLAPLRGRHEAMELAVNDVCYHELARREGDAKAEREAKAWHELYRTLGHRDTASLQGVVSGLVQGYAKDIAGNFSPKVYDFATHQVPRGLNLLFRPQMKAGSADLTQRVALQGHLAELRALTQKGTVVLVPTHSSNLDSVVIGFALEVLGLPPFTYGAGKNLFSNPFISYFMNNLGAYKVDRRLQQGLYKDTLKAYSTVIMERGYHSLFFPGGGRSRSGGVERKLKLGLLGTALSAYIANLKSGQAKPDLFVVPCTINYPLVLEATSQIDDFFKVLGRTRYIITDDEFSELGRIVQYGRDFLSFDAGMFIEFGRPLDLFGNQVDAEGTSRDGKGRPVDRRAYVLGPDGQPSADGPRDAEYTRNLGAAVAAAFLRHNVVMATHLVAFALYELARLAHPQLDVFHLIRLPDSATVPTPEVVVAIERLRFRLLELSAQGRVSLSPAVREGDAEAILAVAMRYFGSYHRRRVALELPGQVQLNNMKLLCYYHNRLVGYGLEALLGPPTAGTVQLG